MTVFLSDADVTVYCGDVFDEIAGLDDGSVDCVITSPPYWGLRDYATGAWEGGDADCDHLQQVGGTGASTLGAASGGNDMSDAARERSTTRSFVSYRDVCGKCGAKRVDKQLGLEATLGEYVENMVELFREVWRVLAPWGTVWLNLGDTYASKNRGTDLGWEASRLSNPGRLQKAQAASLERRGERHRGKTSGLKEKDLIGVPWTVAFALRDDGWYLRMDNIWSKQNPMPESTRDRPTKAHEYVFQLAKSGKPLYWTHPFDMRLVDRKPKPDYWWFPPRGVEAPAMHTEVDGWKKVNVWEGHDYFFDQEAAREAAEWARWGDQTNGKYGGTESTAGWIPSRPKAELIGGRQRSQPGDYDDADFKTTDERNTRFQGPNPQLGTRNMRSVWDIPTQSYPGAHFATFPEDLAWKAMQAGCPERVCNTCGMPSERLVKTTGGTIGHSWHDHEDDLVHGQRGGGDLRRGMATYEREELGLTDCGHNDWRPGIVLDPFGGSGTTAFVARLHQRHAVLIELNEDYCRDQIAVRLRQLSLLA